MFGKVNDDCVLEGSFQVGGVDGKYWKFYIEQMLTPRWKGRYRFRYYVLSEPPEKYEGCFKAKDIYRAAQILVEFIKQKEGVILALQDKITEIRNGTEQDTNKN